MKFLGAFGFSSLDSVPETMGLYSWHLKLSYIPSNVYQRSSKMQKLHFSLNREELELNASRRLFGHLKFQEKYEGRLTRKKLDLSNYDIDDSIGCIQTVFNELSLPIYIGKSRQLNTRLRQHSEAYIEAQSIDPISSEFSEIEFDTTKESSYFGSRLADLNSDTWFLESELFVKVYEAETESYEQISTAEYYLNRTLKPLLGIN